MSSHLVALTLALATLAGPLGCGESVIAAAPRAAVTPAATRPALSVQAQQPMIDETVVRVSEHVWAIMGFPNIGIVVGTRAVLVVDTGLGDTNGATVARVAARLAPSTAKMFLTTTHFHPEHASGAGGFPRGTLVIRNAEQQKELEQHGAAMVEMFRGFSTENRQLLANNTPRPPDVVFDRGADLDLGGGVTVRLLWLGAGHTKGDELTFVLPDRTLISGDIVQNKTPPRIFGDGGTSATWLNILDQLAVLDVAHVLPDHSDPGDGTLITQERALLSELRTHTLALAAKGIAADVAAREISVALRAEHADWVDQEWFDKDIVDFVRRIYVETP